MAHLLSSSIGRPENHQMLKDLLRTVLKCMWRMGCGTMHPVLREKNGFAS